MSILMAALAVPLYVVILIVIIRVVNRLFQPRTWDKEIKRLKHGERLDLEGP
jgi:hypothetical protein